MSSPQSKARLPKGASSPFRVWVNGVEQQDGSDYTVENGSLVFDRPLEKEGKLGLWRWLMLLLGIHGTYRKNDSVDVQYAVGGKTRHATQLDIEPWGDQSS